MTIPCLCCTQIADFGMSRDLTDENYYITTGGRIPVRWTAPEVGSCLLTTVNMLNISKASHHGLIILVPCLPYGCSLSLAITQSMMIYKYIHTLLYIKIDWLFALDALKHNCANIIFVTA